MFSAKLVGCFCGIVSLAFILIWRQGGQQGPRFPDGETPAFAFEVREERKSDILLSRTATILLPKENYSQDNLSKLFRWYMKKYPNRVERLLVQIYLKGMSPGGNASQGTYAEKNTVASFVRQKSVGNPDGGDNAWYYYYPDPVSLDKLDPLERSNTLRYVILMGEPGSNARTTIETWETQNDIFKVRATCYEIADERITPKGFYYTFGYRLVKPKGSDDWSDIFTIRQDQMASIPHNQVRFINDRTGYLFMGWIYAVTTDGAKTWHKWDADRDLPNWRCCDPSLIRDVKIWPDGNGMMQLNASNLPAEISETLYTQDYGKHWGADKPR